MKAKYFIIALTLAIGIGTAYGAANADADRDGVPDAQDQCSQTPAGAKVWTSGPWAGCTHGQWRDADLAAAIVDCESRTDATLGAQHIYQGSGCAGYAYQINDATTPYISWARQVAGRPLHTLGNAYLLYRADFCRRTSAAVMQLLANMQASGCDPGGAVLSGYSGGGDSPYEPSGGSSGSAYPPPANDSNASGAPSGGGGFVSNNGTMVTPTGGGGYVSNNGTMYTPTGGGGYVDSHGTMYTPTGGGGYVDSHGTMYTPTGGGGYVSSNGTMYTPTGGGGFMSSGGPGH